MEKLIATLHNNSMGAKSPSLVSSGPAVLSSSRWKDPEYRKRGNSAMKIGRKPGLLRAIMWPFDRPLSAVHSVESFRAKRPFSKARHATSIISFCNVCVLFNVTLRFPLNLDTKRLVLVNVSAVYRFPRHPFASLDEHCRIIS